MTLAVDTDNELMNLKFSNNTTSATNYIASLFALMSVIYERDLQVRLLQGTTFLRGLDDRRSLRPERHRERRARRSSEFRNYWDATTTPA